MPCIAIVEDSLPIRTGMELLLSARGCEVVMHDRAAGAAEFVMRHRPAVVIVDLHLEYSDAGLDVVHALRAEPSTADIPLVVWSTDPEVDWKVSKAGLDGIVVLSKYGHASVLLATLSELAGMQPSHDAHPGALDKEY